MLDTDLGHLIRKGAVAIENGNTVLALVHFEDAARLEPTPTVLSYLAFCLASERQQMQKAVTMCAGALKEEPNNPVHYLNLGRIYLVAGQKQRAIQAWRKGLKLGRNPQLLAALKQQGMRRPPVLPSLGREHPLNKYLGILLKKVGMR